MGALREETLGVGKRPKERRLRLFGAARVPQCGAQVVGGNDPHAACRGLTREAFEGVDRRLVPNARSAVERGLASKPHASKPRLDHRELGGFGFGRMGKFFRGALELPLRHREAAFANRKRPVTV